MLQESDDRRRIQGSEFGETIQPVLNFERRKQRKSRAKRSGEKILEEFWRLLKNFFQP